jgi:hypothetical protein
VKINEMVCGESVNLKLRKKKENEICEVEEKDGMIVVR